MSMKETDMDRQQSVFDTQVGGGHYKDMAIQPTVFFMANQTPFAEACVIKYVLRYRQKNGMEDLKKAMHYLQMLMENLEQEEAGVPEECHEDSCTYEGNDCTYANTDNCTTQCGYHTGHCEKLPEAKQDSQESYDPYPNGMYPDETLFAFLQRTVGYKHGN